MCVCVYLTFVFFLSLSGREGGLGGHGSILLLFFLFASFMYI